MLPLPADSIRRAAALHREEHPATVHCVDGVPHLGVEVLGPPEIRIDARVCHDDVDRAVLRSTRAIASSLAAGSAMSNASGVTSPPTLAIALRPWRQILPCAR